MRFDPFSFLLGLLSASGVLWLLWRFRHHLARLQASAGSQINGTRQFIERAADKRYIQDLLSYLQRRHVAGTQFNLSDILIEPRFMAAPNPLALLDDDTAAIENIFDIVPMFHDMPASYLPYNLETLSLGELGDGSRKIAILGASGMGKSTTLSILALMALGEVAFDSLEHMAEQAASASDEALSEEEHQKREQDYQKLQEKALQKLHDAHAQELPETTGDNETAPVPPITYLLPVLVHLGDIDLEAPVYGADKTLDPAEPLVYAIQQHVSAMTSQVVGSVIYPILEHGRLLVLLDGYDELAPDVRANYIIWLQQFTEHYGHNMIVIAGPSAGYEALITLGFTPAFLRAWQKIDYDLLARRWGAAWAASADDRQGALPDDQVMRQITTDNQGRTILDVTLKIWAGLAGDAQKTGRAGWYDALINRQLTTPEIRDILPALAERLIEHGHPMDQAALEDVLSPYRDQAEDKQQITVLEEGFEKLFKDGVLTGYAGDRYSFAHPQITSYLTGERLFELGSEQAAEVALEPAWHDAFAFAAAQLDMTPVILRKLGAPPDLLYDTLFGMAYWLPDAPSNVPWRGELLKRISAALMAPVQYPTIRARAMAALIASRDNNTLFVLRQASQKEDTHIRQLACIGMGGLGHPEAIQDLAQLMAHEERGVQLAAGLALGAIGTENALEIMTEGLLNGSLALRRAIAETLAALPGAGHDLLREGIGDTDIEVRRATVYGLSRVKELWALTTLYRTMLEDEQWYVRSAAEEAFLSARSPQKEGLHRHPEADALPWLIQWAADRGEGVPAGINARQVLVRVLQEGQPDYQVMAAQTLARLGHVSALKPLYAALRDSNAEVRGAAYTALTDLQFRLGIPLPGLA